ncbi:unnamed protein product, partial [Symbiodinium microadriaticum]
AHARNIKDGRAWLDDSRLPSTPVSPSAEMDDNEDDEMITTVLALLGAMLQLGNERRSVKEEELLRQLVLPALRIISSGDRDSFVGQTAADVALLIMVRGQTPNQPDQRSQVEYESNRSFAAVCRDAEMYLNDPSPAMRGLGVRNIIVALRDPDVVGVLS